MKIEASKVYLTRDGEVVQVRAETDHQGTYRFRCEDSQGRVTWRSAKGRFTSHPHRLDLVKTI